MTVKELIDILSKQDQNKKVYIDYSYVMDMDYGVTKDIEESKEIEHIFDFIDKEIHLSTFKQSYLGVRSIHESKGE